MLKGQNKTPLLYILESSSAVSFCSIKNKRSYRPSADLAKSQVTRLHDGKYNMYRESGSLAGNKHLPAGACVQGRSSCYGNHSDERNHPKGRTCKTLGGKVVVSLRRKIHA